MLTDSVLGGAVITLNSNIVTPSCFGRSDAGVIYQVAYDNDFAFPEKVYITDLDGNIYDNDSLSVGNYCLMVENSLGCMVTSECFEVINPDSMSVTVTTTPATCTAGGTASIALDNASGNYHFDWSDLPSAGDPQNRSGLSAGNYTVTITDDCYTRIENIVIANTCTDTCVMTYRRR